MALDTPGERIKWALKERGISAARLGRHLGLTRGAVSQYWSKRKPIKPHGRIEQIAEFLNLSVEWLLTGRGEPLRESRDNPPSGESVPGNALAILGARLVGVAEGEAWREGGSVGELIAAASQADAAIGPTVQRPDLAGMPQFAFEVRGSCANQTIHSGEYALCAAYRRVRPAGPHPADLVVVEKRRGTNEYKLFIARLHYRQTTWELHYESNDRRWQQERPIRLSTDLMHDAADDCHIEIVGYVLGVFRANPQPRFAT